jgi:uncharacterized protein involved in exopolysaccharide biosynthesis
MNTPDTMQRPWGLHVLFEIWRRRKWLALSTFAAILAAAVSVAAFLPDKYRATATVLIERRAAEGTVPSADTDELETRLQTIGEKILSRAQLESLIRQFQLYRGPRAEGASQEAIVERMRQDTHLELKGIDPLSGRGTTVSFALSYWGDDPRTAAKVANTIATSYVEDNQKSRERQTASSAKFLEAQLDEAKVHVDESSAELARLVARRDGLIKRLVSMEPPNSPQSIDVVRLAKARQELADLLSQYKDNHPLVLRTRSEIRALETRVSSSASDRATASLDGAATQQVKDSLAQAEAAVMSSDYATTREHYLALMKLYDAARLDEDKEQGEQGVRFAILDPAVIPDQPASPNRLRILLAGLAMSIGMAIGMVMVAEQVDTSFHALDDLRAFTQVPILASVSRISTKKAKRRRLFHLILGFFLAAIGLLLVVGAFSWVAHRGAPLLLTLVGGRA